MKNKTVLGVTLSRLIGLVVFLLILGLLNYIQFNNIINLQVVNFLNQNLGVIIILSILFYLGELFSIFRFPLNIPSPLFNSLGGIFLVGFIFRIFYMLGKVLNQDAFFAFKFLEPFAIILVFVIVIISGYIKIVIELIPKTKQEKKKSKVKPKKTEWEDIGNEFKNALYNLASTLKQNLEPKRRRKNK
ncbi:MAG: hypothetical protein U9R34_03670 [Nanoarchaeota archaeon]|nr:hypothetical protein [Nanoarchaeota archaeon]